jgi:hypothetical protein
MHEQSPPHLQFVTRSAAMENFEATILQHHGTTKYEQSVISLQITLCILHTFCECNKLQKLLLSDSLSLPQCYQHFEYRVWQHHRHTEIFQLLDLTARYTTNNKLSKQPVQKQGSTTKVIMYIFNNPLKHNLHTGFTW